MVAQGPLPHSPWLPVGPSPSDLFIGQVTSQGFNASAQFRVSEVAFAPGGRTKSHTFHQVLVIVDGGGVVATEDREVRVAPADVLYIAPGTRHWPGAAAGAAMTHLSINGAGGTSW
jgi:quercetin dioxygenase-like cupin family protein